MKSAIIGFAALAGSMPAMAQTTTSDPLAPLVPAPQATQPLVIPAPPAVAAVATPNDWRGVFDAIDAGNWPSAWQGIMSLPQGPLTAVAKAELFTAKGSPPVDLNSLQTLIAEAPELPQAYQLAMMALKRGAMTAPLVVPERQTVNLGSAPVRYRTKPVGGEPAADQLRATLDDLVKANDAAGAEAQLIAAAPQLSVEARAEAGDRVAFIFYILGLDLDARRVADTWRQGARGEWAGQSAWISALASWRLGDYNAASAAFQQTAPLTQQRELRAGAYYWAARSEQAAGRPRSVEPLMRFAAASPESFYGLIARETLGMSTRLSDNSAIAYDPPVDQNPNVKRAIALAQIGEPALAEEMLRHQAKICAPAEHHALIQVAKRLDLPAAQLWLANNGQPGARSDPTDRYPNPRWTPLNGWRVDPALAFGHVVQESSFRRTALSAAGAVGLMQVRPGTAGDMARARGLAATGSLVDPRNNLEYGQSYIEMMRRSSGTAGQLPRVIASYNAGPLPVARWASIPDKGDPLLWIESIPYWETRYYVPAVMRNMWVYQGLNGEDTTTLQAMAEHHWPQFPTGMTRLSH